ESLEGLNILQLIGGDLKILNNTGLTDLCGIQNVLIFGGVGGVITISGNLFNPSVADIISGNCSI
ncbi:MAG: hypothetical protein K8R41_11810, partial [Bacteroidales bacterium]|nr:hypothetical protein [Bacteroidales bacterium]